MARIFVTGASGFMGRRLSAELLHRGHDVTALVRPGSEARVAPGSQLVKGDALDARSYQDILPRHDNFVHLVGVSHPSPAKAAEFRSIDLASAKQSLSGAVAAAVPHFVYVSVAHPAPMMREYIAARMEVEQAIRDSGIDASILRPWYVLGPGRRWPLLLAPAYWMFSLLPATRQSALRLGLVTIDQMIAALVGSIEHSPSGVRVLGVPQIRQSATGLHGTDQFQ